MMRILWAGLLFLGVLAGQAQAQSDYPARPVRIIVPSPPGGGTDIVARVLAQHFSRAFGQQFFVENKPGAGNMIGIEAAARSAPDGCSLRARSPSTPCCTRMSRTIRCAISRRSPSPQPRPMC
jgi:tripartite-type tricarboxylate transporter receptor subunit TctC